MTLESSSNTSASSAVDMRTSNASSSADIAQTLTWDIRDFTSYGDGTVQLSVGDVRAQCRSNISSLQREVPETEMKAEFSRLPSFLLERDTGATWRKFWKGEWKDQEGRRTRINTEVIAELSEQDASDLSDLKTDLALEQSIVVFNPALEDPGIPLDRWIEARSTCAGCADKTPDMTYLRPRRPDNDGVSRTDMFSLKSPSSSPSILGPAAVLAFKEDDKSYNAAVTITHISEIEYQSTLGPARNVAG